MDNGDLADDNRHFVARNPGMDGNGTGGGGGIDAAPSRKLPATHLAGKSTLAAFEQTGLLNRQLPVACILAGPVEDLNLYKRHAISGCRAMVDAD